MNHKFIATLLTTTLILAGCGSKSSLVEYTSPAIEMVATRGVGENLLEHGTGLLVPEFELSQDATVGSNRIPKGRYEYYWEDRKELWFSGGEQLFYINKSDQTVCIEGKGCAKIEYTLNKKLSPDSLSPDSLQQTLLYNGKIGSRITLGYREFLNNMALAAFSNSVDYDLSESTIVGYKGARLEIIKATNTEVTYRVLSGFAK